MHGWGTLIHPLALPSEVIGIINEITTIMAVHYNAYLGTFVKLKYTQTI